MYLKCPSDAFIPIVFTIYFTFKIEQKTAF